MPRSSDTSTPRKPSSPRSRSVAIRRDSVAGRSGSSAGIQHVRRHERLQAGARPPPRTAPAPRRAGDRRRGRRRAARGASRSRVAVAGDSACRSRPARRPRSPRQNASACRATASGARPERAVPDHRIVRVRVHVEHRREVPAHAHRGQLLAQGAPDGLRARGVTRRPDRQHRRPHGGGRAQPLHQAPFLVDRHQQRAVARGGPRRSATRAASCPGLTMFGRNSITPPDLRGGDARAQLVARDGPVESDGEQLSSKPCERRHSGPGSPRRGNPESAPPVVAHIQISIIWSPPWVPCKFPRRFRPRPLFPRSHAARSPFPK